ncbi:hypothetical protein OSB04_un000158 [Centaurea solstitialis]|uniref:DUF4283 domain-containing protein n=1 Tax=Centaurea solstitialis TaxID=347529 RepID=A0AA38S5P2_9ASTR|nr:hypothetical protein OSB04_un000158 [Centaurea solstitialis]
MATLADGGGSTVNVNSSCSVDESRVSVFQRLSKPTDARLEFSLGEKAKFADIVGGKSTALRFFPPESKGSLVFCCLLSQRVPFQIVQQAVKRAWGKYGFSDIMMNANGVYFLKFNDVGGCEQVVEQGPLFIRDAPLFVFRWDPSKGLSKPVHTSCPLWVKLHDIPLAAFNVEGIGRIASVLGVPKQMDSATAAMCDKSWGRPGFAKVLVDTWATGDLKREIDVEVPSLQGEDSAVVKVRVEYIWEPAQCNHCMVFGHKKSGCAKAIVDSSNKLKPKLRDDDGFTRVTKKQWVPKANVGESSSVAVTSKPVDSGELPTSNPFDVLEDLDGGVKDGATVANVQGDGKSVGDVSELVEGSVVETSCHEPILEQLKDFQPLVSNLVADSSKLEDMRGVGGSVSNQQTKPVVDKLKEKVDVQKPPIRGILKNPIRSMQAQGDTGIAKAVLPGKLTKDNVSRRNSPVMSSKEAREGELKKGSSDDAVKHNANV